MTLVSILNSFEFLLGVANVADLTESYDVMQNAMPDVLCVVQVALEGAISKKAALNSLAQGNLPQVRNLL